MNDNLVSVFYSYMSYGYEIKSCIIYPHTINTRIDYFKLEQKLAEILPKDIRQNTLTIEYTTPHSKIVEKFRRKKINKKGV